MTVTVGQPPSGTFTATPRIFPVGGGLTTLHWTSRDATFASIDQGIGTIALNGSDTVTVTSTRTFTLTLSNGTMSVQYPVTVVVSLDKDVQLGQNFPNPFNPTTKIPYIVYRRARVRLSVFNILGQLIATLINEEQDPGYYQPEFNISQGYHGTELTSGIYFYHLEVGGVSITRKLLLLK